MTKAAELAKMGEVLTNSQIGGRRNIAYNGAMQIAQRSTSETGLGASSGYFTLDRFKLAPSSTAGRLTMAQESITDLPGFANAMKFTCTTADTSIAAGETLLLRQFFEGQDLQQLKKGTSSAEEFTISFYVKGNANATYMVEVYDGDNTRNNTQQFAVTSSWNRISLTFAADTTGAFNDDNTLSLYLNFWLHAGSNFTSGTYTANTWGSPTDANRAVGISSFFSSTDNTFFLTGLQMEVGSQATPFEHRSFGEELALCQRYCLDLTPVADTAYPYISGTGAVANSTITVLHNSFPVEMRTTPTVVMSGTAGDYYIYNGGAIQVTAFQANGLSPRGGGINFSVSSGVSAGQAAGVYTGSNVRSIVDAEL